jgi:predicted metal-binding membrane protein
MKCDFELILLQNYSSVMDRATATKGKRVNILKLTASGNLDAWQVLGIGLPP